MKAALWLRVSTQEQETANQGAALSKLAAARDLEIARTFTVTESAYKGEHRAQLQELIKGAQQGQYQVVFIWALDRLSREGPLATLEAVDRLLRAGCTVVSLQEPWLEASGELRDLLISLVAWIARWESARRSERTKAGLARAVAEGKPLGRPTGAGDKRKRQSRREADYRRRYT